MKSLWLGLMGSALVSVGASACSEANDSVDGSYNPAVDAGHDAPVTGHDATTGTPGKDAGQTSEKDTGTTTTKSDAGAPPAGDGGAGDLVIDEISGKGTDWVELFNTGSAAVDIGGWGVTEAKDDDAGVPGKPKTAVTFPAGTMLAAGAYALAVGAPSDGGTPLGCPASVCAQATWNISNSHGATIYLLDSIRCDGRAAVVPGRDRRDGPELGEAPERHRHVPDQHGDAREGQRGPLSRGAVVSNKRMPMAPLMRRLAALALVTVCACDDGLSNPQRAVVVDALERYNMDQMRSRPALTAGMYADMSVPGINFFRGSLAIYEYDWQWGLGGLGASRFDLEVPLVPCVGDPHPENFGTLLAPDGTVAVELDDFDAADLAPYLFDVRRFAAGLAVAAHLANPDDPAANAVTTAAARSIALAGATGYAEGIQAAAAGMPPGRVTAPSGSAFLDALLAKAAMGANNRDELTTDTVMDAAGNRTLVRGVLDPDDPQNIFADLPDFAVAELPSVLEAYRTTLVSPPPPDYFTVLDAVREFGAGVSSWANIRAIVLIRGASDDPSDDELLEVKELRDSGTAGLYPPGIYADSVDARVITLSRAAWARPDADPFWGASQWEGMNVQVRHEAASNKGVKVDAMTGALGTVPVLTDLAEQLGKILARLHSASVNGQPGQAAAIWSVISTDVAGFEAEQADVGAAYANQSLSDFVQFQGALQTLGLSLGLPPDPGDAPRPDEAALIGTPPAPLVPTPPSP